MRVKLRDVPALDAHLFYRLYLSGYLIITFFRFTIYTPGSSGSV